MYYAGDTIVDYISHIVSGSPVTGATFTVVSALKPDGSAFTPTITEVSEGAYQVSVPTGTTEHGVWYLLVADTTLTPDVYYESTWTVDPATAYPGGVATTGVSLARLRRDVGDQIGDVLVCTATATSGSTSQFIDTVNLVHGTNTLAGRQAIMVSGSAANLGTVHLITGNTPSAGSIDVRPDFAVLPSTSNVLEIYNTDGGGPGIRDIDRAINRAIRDAGPNALVEVTATAVAYDAAAPTYTIPDSWYGFIRAEWEDEDTSTWRTIHTREVDRIGRTVAVGRYGVNNAWLQDRNVILRGYVLPGELTNDDDETAIDPTWLVNQASYHALIRSANKRTPTQANLALGAAQAFREEAARTQNLARPRLLPFVRLGAV